jgi:Flp pilus assembly protein TadD
MARREADVVSCTKCGSRVPDQRSRCGRCGSTATIVERAPASSSGVSSRLIAVGVGALALVAAAAWTLSPGAGVAVASSQPGASVASASVTSAANASAGGEPKTSSPDLPAEATGGDYVRSGVAAYNSGDLATAAAKLTEAVRNDPDDAVALDHLGQVLVRSGKAREAIQYFDRAIALNQSEWKYRFNRARAFSELQDWSLAVAGYQDAVRLFPSDYVTHFNLAKAREAGGDLTGAIESYGKAVELAPGQADFHLWYGRALDRAGRSKDAVAAYKQFLELEPGAPQAEKVKARLAELGDPAGERPRLP